jgi:hypothetical protein
MPISTWLRPLVVRLSGTCPRRLARRPAFRPRLERKKGEKRGRICLSRRRWAGAKKDLPPIVKPDVSRMALFNSSQPL